MTDRLATLAQSLTAEVAFRQAGLIEAALADHRACPGVERLDVQGDAYDWKTVIWCPWHETRQDIVVELRSHA